MASLEDESFHDVNSHFVHQNDDSKWVPLSLTLVEYPQGSLLGLFLALISLMPFAVIAGFFTLILFRRDLHTIVFFVGVAINDVIGLFLKYTIKEARPMRRAVVYTEYGMPSAHSQFMWFFAAYTTLFVCISITGYHWLNYWASKHWPIVVALTMCVIDYWLHQNNNSSVSERFWRSSIIASCVALALLVSFSRIYLQYHTFSQVFWGTMVGLTLGVAWFFLTHLVFTPFFPIIVSWRLSEYLLLRDTTLIPNVLWFEYTNIRTETRARSRKLVSMKSQ